MEENLLTLFFASICILLLCMAADTYIMSYTEFKSWKRREKETEKKRIKEQVQSVRKDSINAESDRIKNQISEMEKQICELKDQKELFRKQFPDL